MARVQSNHGIPPTILDETSVADQSKTPLQQQPPLELATTQHETTAAPTSPQIRQQREHHVMKEPQPSAESAYLERDQRPGRTKPVGFYKVKIHRLGLVATVANTILMAMACEAVGSLTAYSAMQGFDAVTETFDAINIVSYRASVASKKGKKGEDPDFPTFQQAMMSPNSDE